MENDRIYDGKNELFASEKKVSDNNANKKISAINDMIFRMTMSFIDYPRKKYREIFQA